MTMIIRKTLFLILLLTTIISCNNDKSAGDVAETGSNNIPEEKKLADAVSRFPDSLSLREKLVQYYREEGDYDKAISAADQLLQKDSANARFWDIKATLHFENADTPAAIHGFEKAVSILPTPEYLMSLGSLYAQTKNEKALGIADLLFKADNGRTAREAVFIRGLYYSYTGDKTKAIALFDQCLLGDYTFMPGYLEKAIALYDLGKYADAATVLEKAVTLQNNFSEGYYWRGRCFEKLNKPADAIEAYQSALMYDPEYAEAKDALKRLGVN